MRDIDAVRRAMSNTYLVGPTKDMRSEAREWLDAAARIHAMKRAVTTEALLVNVTSSLVDRIETNERVRMKLKAGVVITPSHQSAGNAKVTVGKNDDDDAIPDDDFGPPPGPVRLRDAAVS
jgi:hypothetical protein